ncbi:glycine receptor subunit alpha-2-like isoform X2 [Saccostrea cucullata]|uniref:glycine receptor subunit alpha-2-like isoform X2 n=1 Tax=Saccostrea cuccullata TaxID=36930 RepID=UPI002ED0F2EB
MDFRMPYLSTGDKLCYIMILNCFLTCGCKSLNSSNVNITRKEILNSILDGYEAWISPNYDKGRPIIDIVQLYVLSIDSIRDANMDYTMSFYFRQRWIDPRLIYNASYGIEVIELDTKLMERIWVPDIYFVNEKQATMHDVTVPNKMMYLYPSGLVLYSTRITGVFSCMMNLQKYPLDRQICSLRLESYAHSAKTIVVRWKTPAVEFSPSLLLPQFEIEKNHPSICDTLYMGINYSCVALDIHLKRNHGYYVTQIYVPSALVVVLSWVNFWLTVDAVPARISLGLLTVLTMTTQSTSFFSNLQKVSYIKALDVWLAVCMMFVFSALLEFAYVNVTFRVTNRRKSIQDLPMFVHTNGDCKPDSVFSLGGVENDVTRRNQNHNQPNASKQKKAGLLESLYSKEREKARNIDRISRILFPVAFLVFNIAYWCVYLLWEPTNEPNGS